MIYPSVSILTITYNPDVSVFRRSLESIRKQKYPKAKIEHIVVDGGSKSDIISLAKEYGCIVIVRKDLRDQSEARRSYAVRKAKNEIVFWLESDNILQDENTLKELVQPFHDDPKILSTFTLHYGLNPHASILDRYCALFGASDPVVMYLQKADREPWYRDQSNKGKIVKHTDSYDIVEFTQDNLPTVGDNGFLTRRDILLKANISPQEYVHIDIYVDLLKFGYNRFGVVRSTAIEHEIGKSLIRLVQRRVLYAQRFTLSDAYIQKRRYFIFSLHSWRDRLHLLKFIFSTVTFIEPLIVSIRGFIIIRDIAWFYHPIVCLLFLVYYMRYTFQSGDNLKRITSI